MTQEKLETKPSRVVDRKREKDQPPTKIFIRRLPPSLTPEAFLEQVSPLPNYDFFYFSKADNSLGPNAFTRAYIKFQNLEDIYIFRDRFDGYIFIDAKGNEYPAIVEYAPFQRVPKRKIKKPDSKKGTIDSDPDYLKFLESLQNTDTSPANSIDNYLEELENKEKELKANPAKTTPLIEYLRKRKEEKKAAILRLRDERKKREVERRKAREEERKRRKDKEKERERAREKQLRDRDAKQKDKPKEVNKPDKEQKKDEQPIKLLKNPEREKEKEKEPVNVVSKDKFKDTPKLKDDRPKEREKLRFSKENPGENGLQVDKTRARKFGREDRGGRSSWADRPRSAKEDRFSDRNRSNRDRDKDRGHDRFRDDRPRSTGSQNSRDEKRTDYDKSTVAKKEAASKTDKDRSKVENKSSEKGPIKGEKESGDRSKGIRDNQSATSEKKAEDLGKVEVNGSGEGDRSETDEKRKRRKDRPERAIYDPRKAMERRHGARQQQDSSKSPTEESESKSAETKAPKPKEKDEKSQKVEEKGEKNPSKPEDKVQKSEEKT
ncbi:hypothetical protein ScPMuIL_018440 [Solemya velum]